MGLALESCWYLCLPVRHICSAFVHSPGTEQNVVGHHVLHYIGMSEEDTPREECNFKLEKND